MEFEAMMDCCRGFTIVTSFDTTCILIPAFTSGSRVSHTGDLNTTASIHVETGIAALRSCDRFGCIWL
jgi:hypothetical protein